MDEYHFQPTERIQRLIVEAEQLAGRPVLFRVMRDAEMLKLSSGAAIDINQNEEIIYVDPARYSEYAVAHELMHLILHRSGWPKVFGMIADPPDHISQRLADGLDNICDHAVFDPQLEHAGIDLTSYRQRYMVPVERPSAATITGANIVWQAFNLLNPMLWGGEYRQRVIAAAQDHPMSLNSRNTWSPIFGRYRMAHPFWQVMCAASVTCRVRSVHQMDKVELSVYFEHDVTL